MAQHKLFDLTDTFIGLTDAQFESRLKKLTLKEKENLYLESKDRYSDGKPIMTDPQFDRLEQWLESEMSPVIGTVGGGGNVDKLIHEHLSPMLSLSKIQVNDEDNFPLNEIEGWNTPNIYPLEATPKYDGNAIELQYNDGRLIKAITRGKKGKGSDVTSKLLLIVPSTISSKLKLEVRGEILVPLDKFREKYMEEFKNSRNMIGGVLNRDEDFEDIVKDSIFVAYSLKNIVDDGSIKYVDDTMNNLTKLGFNSKYTVPVKQINGPEDFRKVYDAYKKYRAESNFLLDGIVFKMPEEKRSYIGENNHHPKWSVALKFPSKEAITKILFNGDFGVEWNVGSTGELSPVGILDPVDLDGSTVGRVSLYNKSKMEQMGMFPGATVVIKKSGDIIPQIIRVEIPSPNASEYISKQNYYPKNCPACGSVLVVEITASKRDKAKKALLKDKDVNNKVKLITAIFSEAPSEHIMCKNENCVAKNTRKLALGIAALGIKGIGESLCADLVNSGIKNIFDFLNKDKMNTQSLSKFGILKPGRQLELILNGPKKLSKVELHQAIAAIQFESLGDTGSKQVAKMFANVSYSFEGLEKAVVEPFLDDNSTQTNMVKEILEILGDRGVEVVMPKNIAANAITFEMTGPTTGAGYKTKEELVQFLSNKGYVHTKLKEAKLLLTDSYSGSSTKMKDAIKKGIKIMTYEDLINSLK